MLLRSHRCRIAGHAIAELPEPLCSLSSLASGSRSYSFGISTLTSAAHPTFESKALTGPSPAGKQN